MSRFLLSIYFLLLCPCFLSAEQKPILLMIGTRPEAIKVIPVYNALKQENLSVIFCSTGQHIDLVNEVLSVFQIRPDFNFNIMKPKQDLVYITEAVLSKTVELLQSIEPSLVVVQGDTTTAMSAALAAFYCKIPVAHIEAGLRTNNIYAPFPEEMNRQLISKLASLHFTPTSLATQQLKSEGIAPERIFETGNTGVDALFLVKEKIEKKEILPTNKIIELIEDLEEKNQSIILLTVHRRESLESGIEEVMKTIYTFLETHPSVTVVYPVHPNPLISDIIKKTKLDTLPNLILLQPLPYSDLIYILLKCRGVMTDSGGIQEEAISLNKFTLVLRNETDRTEGLKAGIAHLVGTNPVLIRQGIEDMLKSDNDSENANRVSPYGDGRASERIVQIIKQFLNLQP